MSTTTTLTAPVAAIADIRSLALRLRALFASTPRSDTDQVDVWTGGARGL